ncbi:cytochrome P450, partial [Thalassotalea sp. G20_0]
VELEQGALLNINFAAANRDESRFDNPNEFNPLRANVKRHFSFGGGKHQCMGRLLATREVIEVLQAVLADARQLTFASGYSPAIEGVAFRSPAQLHLQWK